MLSVKNRFNGSYYIEKTKKRGKLFQFDHFGIVVLNREDDAPTRFAFVVSTKVTKLAIQRNRIKRVISESIRYEIKNLVNGYDVVFLIKSSAVKVSSEDLMKEAKNSLIKLKLIV